MSQGQNTIAVGIQLVQAAPAIVHFIQMLGSHAGATNEEKKQAAVEAGKAIAIGAGQAALANNPKVQRSVRRDHRRCVRRGESVGWAGDVIRPEHHDHPRASRRRDSCAREPAKKKAKK
jgi:hypothetical protein